MKFTVFLIFMLCFAMADARDVYRWVAPDGSVQYSDNPHAGADRITLPEWPEPQPQRTVLPPPPRATDRPVLNRYDSLAIADPEVEEKIRDNQGNVEVTVTVKPDLIIAEGHKIQLLLDGQAQGGPAPSLAQSLRGVERGSHTVAAQVVDERGRILIRSRPVSFYLEEASPLFHPADPNWPDEGVQQAPRAPMAPRAPRAPTAPFRPPPPTPKPPPL